MKDAKILLIIKNVDLELAEKIQKLIATHNRAKNAEIVSKDDLNASKRKKPNY